MLLLLRPPTSQVVKRTWNSVRTSQQAHFSHSFCAQDVLLIGGYVLVRSSDTSQHVVQFLGLLNALILR